MIHINMVSIFSMAKKMNNKKNSRHLPFFRIVEGDFPSTSETADVLRLLLSHLLGFEISSFRSLDFGLLLRQPQ